MRRHRIVYIETYMSSLPIIFFSLEIIILYLGLSKIAAYDKIVYNFISFHKTFIINKCEETENKWSQIIVYILGH